MTCSVEDCNRQVYGHGLCSMHYARQRRHGSTLTVLKPANGARLTWLMDNIGQATDACLVFPFPPASHGYADVKVNGKSVLAHRYACEAKHGPPPDDRQFAAHSCGNKLCVNPSHLRWATRRENEADKLLQGRDTRGERHGGAKLNKAQVTAIRHAGGTQRSVAARFGIAQQTVSDIKRGRRWSWL